MANFPDSTSLPKFLQTMSRRRLLSAAPAAVAAASIPVFVTMPKLTPQEEYNRFEAAMKLAFNPVAYVNYVTVNNDCFSIYRGEKLIMYKCWLFQFDGVNNCDNFLGELNRRNWAYKTLPGEKLCEAERRIEDLRKRQRLGAYAHIASEVQS